VITAVYTVTLIGVQPAAGQGLVRLASGDSVLVLGSAPARVPGSRGGLLIDFDPFVSRSDTIALRRKALELWSTLRWSDDSLTPVFVVLRAVDRDDWFKRLQRADGYGFVFEKRRDGKWYLQHDSVSAQQRAKSPF